jgi:hypothetical protein
VRILEYQRACQLVVILVERAAGDENPDHRVLRTSVPSPWIVA